jgi:hypothetical protein
MPTSDPFDQWRADAVARLRAGDYGPHSSGAHTPVPKQPPSELQENGWAIVGARARVVVVPADEESDGRAQDFLAEIIEHDNFVSVLKHLDSGATLTIGDLGVDVPLDIEARIETLDFHADCIGHGDYEFCVCKGGRRNGWCI